MRGNLDRTMSDLEQLKSGSNNQDDQRRAVLGQLAQNNCGAQYTAAANAAGGPRGFFDALFGGGTVLNPEGDGAPSGTFHTVCVRTCDGYYFPISYSTTPNHFPDDQRACQRECPAAEATLYAFRNPGEGMEQAMSINGQAVHGAAHRVPVPQAVHAGMLLPAAGPELGRRAERCRRSVNARERRHRRN